MNRLDPRSPLVLDTKELGRRAGSMREVTRDVEFAEPVGTDLVAISAGSPVRVQARLESVLEGVLITGTATAVAAGMCVRCLEPFTYPVAASFQELFVHPDRAAHNREIGASEDDGSEYVLIEDLIDLAPVLVDAIVPALPFQPVCRADCLGLCAQCGFPLADDPDHAHDLLDPRWSALSPLASSAFAEEPPSTKGT